MAFDREIDESYETTTGLVDDFTGTVTDALFTFDNAYNDGETCLLKLTVKADDPELFPADEDGEGAGETTLIYPCGKGFEPAEKGTRVQHDTGKPKKFHKLSGMGLLLDHALQLDGLVDILKSRGPATQADIWVGLNFDFEDVSFSNTDRDGETRTWSRTLPVAFNGEGEGEGEKKPAKKAPAKKAAAKKADAEESAEGPELDAKTRGKLKAIAASADDHDSFMEEAFATLELDDAGEAAVADEDFYQSLKAS